LESGVSRLEERQAAITELALILNPKTPSPNEAMIVNAWLKVTEIQFMNQFGKPKPRSRYSWKDIAIITAVVVGFGGFVFGMTYMVADTAGAGLECLVVHCVKVIK
jgi:hypothetical protein